ncbi:transcription antitermination factor NusB [Candidatus Daviesbacteria bacterium]|nr:transcription antitermination factor NusB [Candidatus Daviesbacteria bacterium]
MKTAKDPRHLQRIRVVQNLYAKDMNKQHEEDTSISDIVSNVEGTREKIDKEVLDAAPTWPLEKINKIDLAILRLAIFELLIEGKTPPKVIVDEAVEIAKEYGSDSSASFINGVLGKVIETHQIKI